MSTRSATFLTFCLVFAFLANYGAADPRAWNCTYQRNYTKGSLTEKNLQRVLGELLNSSSQPAAYKISYAPGATVGGGGGSQNSSETTAIYGLLQCYASTNSSQCNQCAQHAVNITLTECSPATAAMAWFDDCFLRFDNSNFTGVVDTNDVWYLWNLYNATDGAVYDKAAHQLLNNLITKALQQPSPNYTFATNYAFGSSPNYAFGSNYVFGSNVSERTPIYGFVQCWRDISAEDCGYCLDVALSEVQNNVNVKGKLGGGTLTSSCFVRYEAYPFYTATPPSPPDPLHAPPPQLPAPALSSDGSMIISAPLPAPPPRPKTPQLPAPALSPDGSNKHLSTLAVIISATVGSLLGVLVLLCISFLAYGRTRRRNLETGAMEETQDNLAGEGVITMFNMETLKAATNNFDENLKLGQGGFGVVYKATLPNGEVVAAKRLLVPSFRGKQEFVNEINLLAQIQHRNLIVLLGCCTEGSHRILVYELLPNGSLDKILFDRQKATFLNWEKRYNVILGTAKVLRYLHEDSKIKIIHRDIKANNILLDEKFDAKIADFGLARLFQEDQSHIQTGVAGTYGYMAPEYAMQGQLSTKSDVYSFGVLVAEIIAGKRNSEFGTDMSVSSLLGWAWNLYQEGKISMMVDEVVKATGSMEEVIRCIHVALLCTQVDPSLRPPMSTVLLMLSSASITLPIPTQPAFVILKQSVERTPRSTQKNSTLINLSPTTQHFTNATVSTSDIEPR